MKRTKKMLALVLALSMLVSLFAVLPSMAAELTDAEKLEAMNLFRGDSAEGLTQTYLAKRPDRKTAARLLLRFTGLEEDADAYKSSNTFSDASDATVYWQNMLAYLKNHPDAGFVGYPDGTFKPNQEMEAQAFYKVLLEVLGYKQDVDFTWADTFTFAESVGLKKLKGKKLINNNEAAIAMVEALNANTTEGKALINQLVEDEIVSATDAAQAGFITVTSVTGYEATYTIGLNGNSPLPAKVNVTYSDGSTADVTVKWGTFDASKEGSYNVKGTVAGYGDITSKVTVTRTLLITEAFASGTKEITVVFNMPVPTNTAVTTKFGAAILQGLTQTWSTDRRTLRITRAINYPVGKYSISISTSTKEFDFEAEKLAEIVFQAETVYPQAGAQDLGIKFYNQYGLAMNPSTLNLTFSALSPQKPDATFVFTRTIDSVTLSGVNSLKVGDTINIFVVDNATAIAVSKFVTVATAPKISSFVFDELTIADKQTRILKGTFGHTLSVNVTDQYGNPYKLRSGNLDISNVVDGSIPLFITSTDTAIVNPANISVIDGKLYFSNGAIGNKEGTVTLTVMSPLNPNMGSVRYTLTVESPATISTLNIQGISGELYAGQWASLVMTAQDQYGKAVPLSDIVGSLDKLWTQSTHGGVVIPGQASEGSNIKYDALSKTIMIRGNTAGVTTLTFSFNNIVQGTLTVQVMEAPKPIQINNVNIASAFQKEASADLTFDNFSISDQYGRVVDLAEYPGYKINIKGSNGWNVDVDLDINGKTITAPNADGNYTLTFKLLLGATEIASLDKSVNVLGEDGVSSYQIESIGLMYAGGGADYWKKVNITGRSSTGATVQLKYNNEGLPSGVSELKVTNTTNFEKEIIGGRIVLKAKALANTSSTATTKLQLVSNTGLILTTLETVESRGATPQVNLNTLVIEYTPAAGGVSAKVKVLGKDQYGVASDVKGDFYSANVADILITGPFKNVSETEITVIRPGIVRFVSSGGYGVEKAIN